MGSNWYTDVTSLFLNSRIVRWLERRKADNHVLQILTTYLLVIVPYLIFFIGWAAVTFFATQKLGYLFLSKKTAKAFERMDWFDFYRELLVPLVGYWWGPTLIVMVGYIILWTKKPEYLRYEVNAGLADDETYALFSAKHPNMYVHWTWTFYLIMCHVFWMIIFLMVELSVTPAQVVLILAILVLTLYLAS